MTGGPKPRRQLKLGAVTMGAGGPGQHYLWLDEEIPGDAPFPQSALKPTPFAGSPSTVAEQIQRWFDARALDGLNVHIGHAARQPRPADPAQPLHRGVTMIVVTDR